jgi:hypothetical protein
MVAPAVRCPSQRSGAMREVHVMTVSVCEDSRTVRYTCPWCRRCMEDGPQGLKVLFRGDVNARHRAGSLVPSVQEIEAEEPPLPPTLH